VDTAAIAAGNPKDAVAESKLLKKKSIAIHDAHCKYGHMNEADCRQTAKALMRISKVKTTSPFVRVILVADPFSFHPYFMYLVTLSRLYSKCLPTWTSFQSNFFPVVPSLLYWVILTSPTLLGK